jgi:hypothetical protein
MGLGAGRSRRPASSWLLLACLGPWACTPEPSRPPIIAYENGVWFTGSGFEPRAMYAQGTRFVEPRGRPDSVVDLGGGFVVAPFGEAHNHNVDPRSWDSLSDEYMRGGVFYVLNPNNLPEVRDGLAARINRPGTPDAAFANGGITGPGGHPVAIVEANIRRGEWTPAQGEGAFLFSVSDARSLDAVWAQVLAARPDLVKVYLLYSDAYEARLSDSTTVGWRGMDPKLVPEVVSRAHRAGLRVIAHIESAADFRAAVDAGVDLIAHMPGFRGNEATLLPDPAWYEISAGDARLAAGKGIVVISTLAGLAEYAVEGGDGALRSAADRLNEANLATLLDAGVDVAIGSDMYDDTSVREALYLATLDAFGTSALLRSWSEITPRAIFPDRDIGRFEPGYEASFLVLDGNPLEDFQNVTRIRMGVKQGHRVAFR